MKQLAKITNGLIGQPMFNLLARINQLEEAGRRIIHFEIGDPNFPSPPGAVSAAHQALDNGETHYTNSMGMMELRRDLCDYTRRTLGFKPDPEQILVSPANAIIDYTIRCVADPDDEVMYPDPGFPTYHSVLSYTGNKGTAIPLLEENGFVPDPSFIRRHITAKTKLIIVNSPHNPTGSMMDSDLIKEIYDIAEQNDIYLLSDEVYGKIVYDKPHYSPGVYDKCADRVIILDSFSKVYSMSGWRMGYAIGPKHLIEKMGLLLQTTISCLPAFVQIGAQSLLAGSGELVKERNAELKRRRDAIVRGINSIKGMRCLPPDGAFYVFVNVKETGLTGKQMADLLLEKANVAVLDGNCFGSHSHEYIRICYASTDLATIMEAIEKVKTALTKE